MSYQIMAYERDEMVDLLEDIRSYFKDFGSGMFVDEIDNCMEILGAPRGE